MINREHISILSFEQINRSEIVVYFSSEESGLTAIDIEVHAGKYQATTRISLGRADKGLNEDSLKKRIAEAKSATVRAAETKKKAFDLTKKLSEDTV